MFNALITTEWLLTSLHVVGITSEATNLLFHIREEGGEGTFESSPNLHDITGHIIKCWTNAVHKHSAELIQLH